MTDFAALLNHGTSSALIFIPSAILLGTLHGLEPGHSKTMMAAFIVAIRGTVKQAVMLGLAATLSHTVVVWLVAMSGMMISRKFTSEAVEPWFQLISGAIIIGTAAWMFWRTWSDQRQWKASQSSDHHDHDEVRIINTGHGEVRLEIVEVNAPPRWNLQTLSGQKWQANDATLETERADGSTQRFIFKQQDGLLVSEEIIPEPHEFKVRLHLGHGHHFHSYEVDFQEHEHAHDHAKLDGLEQGSQEYQDAHERAHASDISKRFANRDVTNGQILLFGLTGGLVPCPAAITVLLLCIQVKKFALGAALVFCFSIGLALTLVTVGVGAAYSVRHVSKRWSGFSTLARRAPYFSSALIAVVGFYMAMHGFHDVAI